MELNAGREGLPDIDLDLASQVRSRVFGWVLQRYGHEHVARVGSLERWQARSGFRAAAQAHGLLHTLMPDWEARRERLNQCVTE
jgi:DNA polymerase III alpha subunit